MKITRHQPVAPEKLDLAKRLRREMTPEERLIWRALKTDALQGLHFRRQQVVAGYIIDFYCAAARLAVEIDGDSHDTRTEYDSERDHVLAELRIETVRIRNEAIIADLEAVLRRIAAKAHARLQT